MWVVSTEDKRSIVYLLDMELEGKKIRKIGITSKKIEERLQGIAMSIFSKHRYVPYIKPVKYQKVVNALAMEQKILKYMEEYKWTSEKQWGGCTETLDVELDILVDVYEKVQKGEELVEVGEVCDSCGKIKKFVVDGEMLCGHKHKENTASV